MSDRILRSALGAFLLIGGFAACTENPTSSLACPTLCVDESATLRDTILTGVVVTDTSLFGYPKLGDTRNLTLINRGDTADVRVVVRYDSLPQRYLVSGATADSVIRKVDSATLIFIIDTTNTKLTAPVTIDAFDVDTTANDTVTSAVVPLFRPDRLLGSQTFNVGDAKDTIRMSLDNNALFVKMRDSLRLRVGLRIRGPTTRLRILGTTFAPLIRFRLSADTTIAPDTIRPRSVTPPNDVYFQNAVTFYSVTVAGGLGTPPPDRFVVGGLSGARAYIRFDLPSQIIDSVEVIRASLLLTQTPARGKSAVADSIYLYTQPVLASPSITSILTASGLIGSPTAYGIDSVFVAPRDSGLRHIELVNLVRTWRSAGSTNVSRSILLTTPEEGFSPGEISFFSIAAPAAVRPRLRITYVPRRGFGIP